MAAPKRKPAVKMPKQPARARILVVEARYYKTSPTRCSRCREVLDEAKAEWDIVTVPGSLEICRPSPSRSMPPRSEEPYDGAVALGCVIQGETFHFDIVSMQSARALIDFSVARRLPCGNGILTVDTEPQAWARARITEQDKGGDAARAALALIAIKRQRAKK